MITHTNGFTYDENGKAYNLYDFIGLSTDTKPADDTRIGNGSFFMEMDTGKLFIFNGATRTWLEMK